ncbi:MAG TPA: 6-phosphogluconolactonase [Rhizomicrobium sp.]|jgi:6-phosphogluconolactonase
MIEPRLEIFESPAQTAERAANWIVARIGATTGTFRLALSGGSTPKLLYRELATFGARIAWDRLEFYWGDERFVPHDDPRSNCRMARETMLDAVPVDPAKVHPIPTDGDPQSAARRYEETLRQAYGAPVLGERPLFDLVLLGLGEDGHTASLFPGSPLLTETERWVAAATGATAEPRITLTFPPLESSRAILFLVTGEEKARAVQRVLAGDRAMPAARLAALGEAIWLLDSAAASLLPQRSAAGP